MAEEFSEIGNQSIWALIKYIVAIGGVLNNKLPFDYLTPSWHMEDGTEDFTIGISARLGESRHDVTIFTHALDAPPAERNVPAKLLRSGDTSDFFLRIVGTRSFGSLRNS